MSAIYLGWLIPLAIGVLFGWAWGRASLAQELAPPPLESGGWRQGYLAGYEDARDEAQRLAKAHDFAAIERQVDRMKPKP